MGVSGLTDRKHVSSSRQRGNVHSRQTRRLHIDSKRETGSERQQSQRRTEQANETEMARHVGLQRDGFFVQNFLEDKKESLQGAILGNAPLSGRRSKVVIMEKPAKSTRHTGAAHQTIRVKKLDLFMLSPQCWSGLDFCCPSFWSRF